MTGCRTRQEGVRTTLLQRCGSDAANALRGHPYRGIQCYYLSARRDLIATRLDLALRSASASTSARLAVNAGSLPAVIIARILSFLRLEQRIIVSHTCSSWRAAALAAEDLWRNVVIGDYPSVTGVLSLDGMMPSLSQPRPNWAAALSILRRRQSLPASAAVVCNVSQFDAEVAIHSMVSGLRAVVGQVATLYLKAFAERNLTTSYDGTPHIIEHVVCYPAPSSWLAFADSLCSSAPYLESLAVRAPRVMHSDDEPTLYLDPDTLCGEPHVLRTCWLDQVALPPVGCHAFSKLTTFEYDPRNRKITDAEVNDILAGMPCLETLGLTLEVESFFTDQPPLTPSPSRCIVHRLRHLGLMIYADAFSTYAEVPRLLHFFSSLAEPGLVTVADLREPDAWGVSDIEPGSNITSDMDDPDSVHLTTYAMAVHKGSTTLLHSPQYEMPLSEILRPSLDGYNLRNMVQLVISEDLWPEDGAAIPSLPNLRNLCVILLSCTFMLTGPYQTQPRNVLGIFVFLPSAPPLHCPSLTDVRISASQSWNSESPSIPCLGEDFTVDEIRDASFRCTCRNGCILSLADTADFITYRLRFTAPRLSRLTLSGMRDFAEPDGPARSRAFDLLRQICAEEIIVEPDVPGCILDMQAIAEYRDIDSSPVRLLNPRGSVLLGRDPFTLGEQADFYVA
ncbi:hypothetical protein EXIGLDRAFT_774033 [Exidia glandulosa HHB12029]|uniref:F-box domain-containing protein n=1 Tax=Exidia glandulosa HHB12029 TaxID=1314781 RepID=A0A165EJ38_EXIGL|nr:hypothetical protein EXIGLDRAFT_774033 [Exidia glandulosa HHB12029]